MKKLALIGFLSFITCFISHSALSQVPKVSNGSIKRIDNFSSKYVASRNIDVWLPENYSSEKKYAVLYMHDGKALFDSTIMWNKQCWEMSENVSALIQSKKIKDCIVVGIWNGEAKRHCEYFPQKPFESLKKSEQDSIYQLKRYGDQLFFTDKVQSGNYLKFIVEELKPYIDANFATLKDQKNTFISGSSMGGLISLYAICEYPDVFGGAACISTHWTGILTATNNPIPATFMNYLKTNLPNPKNHKIYFDYGTKTLDALYEPFQIQADKIMKEKGFSKKNWQTKKFVDADHSEKSWAKRVAIPMVFLLKK